MSLIGYIRDFDRKFAWSFVGVLLALLFGGITIQKEFFSDLGPHLRYDILVNTPVLDVREDVGKLAVLFDGIDIREQKKSLRVITVRVVNDSQKDILKGFYDEAEPLGLQISSGKIIRCDSVTASNSYLERQLVPRQQNDVTLVFPNVILESQEYFVIKLLVLHDEVNQPKIVPIGKIAGIRSILVAEAYRQQPNPPFLGRTFAGDILVQVIRLFAYAGGMIVVLIITIVPIVYIGDKNNKRKKRKIIAEFKRTTSRLLRENDDFLFDTYVKHEPNLLLSLLSLISNPKALQSAYDQVLEYKKKEKNPVHMRPLSDPNALGFREYGWLHFQMDGYFKSGLLKKTDQGLVVDEHMKGILEEFVAFLEKKDLLEGVVLPIATRELN